MHLVDMDRETASGVETSRAVWASEMLCLLVREEDWDLQKQKERPTDEMG